jgi:hypothetical protein
MEDFLRQKKLRYGNDVSLETDENGATCNMCFIKETLVDSAIKTK